MTWCPRSRTPPPTTPDFTFRQGYLNAAPAGIDARYAWTQPGGRTQRIGNRPDLRQLIARATETATWTGVQFRGTIPAGQTQRWFTFAWPAHWHVLWTVVPTNSHSGSPQIGWRTQVERGSDSYITYWITVNNVSTTPVDIEARFCVLGW